MTIPSSGKASTQSSRDGGPDGESWIIHCIAYHVCPPRQNDADVCTPDPGSGRRRLAVFTASCRFLQCLAHFELFGGGQTLILGPKRLNQLSGFFERASGFALAAFAISFVSHALGKCSRCAKECRLSVPAQ